MSSSTHIGSGSARPIDELELLTGSSPTRRSSAEARSHHLVQTHSLSPAPVLLQGRIPPDLIWPESLRLSQGPLGAHQRYRSCSPHTCISLAMDTLCPTTSSRKLSVQFCSTPHRFVCCHVRRRRRHSRTCAHNEVYTSIRRLVRCCIVSTVMDPLSRTLRQSLRFCEQLLFHRRRLMLRYTVLRQCI